MSCLSYFDALVFDKNKVKKIFLPYKKNTVAKLKLKFVFIDASIKE